MKPASVDQVVLNCLGEDLEREGCLLTLLTLYDTENSRVKVGDELRNKGADTKDQRKSKCWSQESDSNFRSTICIYSHLNRFETDDQVSFSLICSFSSKIIGTLEQQFSR